MTNIQSQTLQPRHIEAPQVFSQVFGGMIERLVEQLAGASEVVGVHRPPPWTGVSARPDTLVRLHDTRGSIPPQVIPAAGSAPPLRARPP